jgi:hypothetical protein
MTTSTPFRDLLHAANLWHGTDGFTSPLKEAVLRIFSPLNLRTWVLKASTLPLDHWSRYSVTTVTVLRCYAAYVGSYLLTFWHGLSVPSPSIKQSNFVEDGTKRLSWNVNKQVSDTLCNKTEERGTHQRCSGSLKSHNMGQFPVAWHLCLDRHCITNVCTWNRKHYSHASLVLDLDSDICFNLMRLQPTNLHTV